MPVNANQPVDGDLLAPTELSFSGVDIIMSASINGKTYILGSIETISISTHRDTAPVRVLGSDAPIAYKQGTRTVSGTMVFSKVYRGEAERLFKENAQFAIGDIQGFQAPDRTSPFNVSIAIGTEYAADAENAQLLGVTLMSSGMTLSVHDLYTEQTYGYVAREYIDIGGDITSNAGISNNKPPVLTLSSVYASLMNTLVTPQGESISKTGDRL